MKSDILNNKQKMDSETQNSSFFYYVNNRYTRSQHALFIHPTPSNQDFHSSISIIKSQKPNNSLTFEELLRFLSYLPRDCTSKVKYYQKHYNTSTIFNSEGEKIFQVALLYDKNYATVKFVSNHKEPLFSQYQNIIKIENESYEVNLLNKYLNLQEEVDALKHGSMANLFPPTHPFRQLGHSIFRHIHYPDLKLKILCQCYSRCRAYALYERVEVKTWETILNKMEGYIFFITTENEHYPIVYNTKHIHSFVYIVAEYRDIITHADVIELDASFFLLSPYVYCIPTAIINNESFPLGVSVGPSEKYLLYQNFYQFIEELDPNIRHHLNTIPILSDQGVLSGSFPLYTSFVTFFVFVICSLILV